MPPFYKHNRNDETSEGHNPIAEPAMRIDISGNGIFKSSFFLNISKISHEEIVRLRKN